MRKNCREWPGPRATAQRSSNHVREVARRDRRRNLMQKYLVVWIMILPRTMEMQEEEKENGQTTQGGSAGRNASSANAVEQKRTDSKYGCLRASDTVMRRFGLNVSSFSIRSKATWQR